jgi:malate synthase
MRVEVQMSSASTSNGVTIRADLGTREREILSADAIDFLADLQRRTAPAREELLQARQNRQQEIHSGGTFDFLSETREIRDGQWRVAPPAPGLLDRRVEITGPTDRKMAINALNSGARVWLADFEDANSPLWSNMIDGQVNVRDAVDRTIEVTSPDGKSYALADNIAAIVVRPRGWHLVEKHLLVDGEPISASLFDFGLYMFHCANRELNAGSGPYFYLPKLESHIEARLWNQVFIWSQEALGIPRGTVRATVLIETVPAAFEMEEILFELREHSAGLNAGRWDYLFSMIKKFRDRGPGFTLPDRNSVTMTAPFMQTYSDLLVQTCHKRGAHAIGGMAAFVPSRTDPEVTARAMAKVREDKQREASAGFDGSWVAHPDLVPLCKAVFDSVLGDRPNQLDRTRSDVHVVASQLLDLALTPGEITEAGLRNNVNVGIQYLASWLRGIGAVALFNLMEDVATAEIARSQVWQWLHNGASLTGGEKVTRALIDRIVEEELEKIRAELAERFDPGAFAKAKQLFVDVAAGDEFVEFLTLPAYAQMP